MPLSAGGHLQRGLGLRLDVDCSVTRSSRLKISKRSQWVEAKGSGPLASGGHHRCGGDLGPGVRGAWRQRAVGAYGEHSQAMGAQRLNLQSVSSPLAIGFEDVAKKSTQRTARNMSLDVTRSRQVSYHWQTLRMLFGGEQCF